MTDLSGKWFLDGMDLFTVFGVFIEEGTADVLRFAPKKESITHDWKDANGIDVDLSRFFFGPRSVTLDLAIICTSKDDFFLKQEMLISALTQPGLRRLTIASHDERSYYVYYKECTSYKAVLALGGAEEGKFAYRFSLSLEEPEPTINNQHTFLVDETGRFLIT